MVKAKLPMSEEEFEHQYATAKEAGRVADETEPRAIAVKYDPESRRVIIDLKNGSTFIFPVDITQGIAGASDEDLSDVRLRPRGAAIHWPRLDWDLGVPELMFGILGSRRWMASQMGKFGGSVKSEAKTAAVRANGAKGGRPRKPESELSSRQLARRRTIAERTNTNTRTMSP